VDYFLVSKKQNHTQDAARLRFSDIKHSRKIPGKSSKEEGFLPGLITAIICLRHSKLIGFKEV
jgi:hypothetical protein